MEPLFDAAGAALVADALRTSTALTALAFTDVDLCVDMRVADALLRALVGHPALCSLMLCGEFADENGDPAALGGLLAALVAADAPALHVLNISANVLRDAGLAPIVAALPRSHHLRILDISLNYMSDAFARKRLLPAVRANTSLRDLVCVGDEDDAGPAAREAQELVQQRSQRS
jgi:hypothetical protein